MASGQRAFATKINRRGASEIRKQVSSAYMENMSKGSSGLSIISTTLQNIPLADIVEPPDFEEFQVMYQNIIDRDPLRHLLEFPVDDIIVEVIRRKMRTLAPVIPERGYEADRHVKDCVKNYTKDYRIVNRRQENCSKQHLDTDERARHLQHVTPPEYELHYTEANYSRHKAHSSSTADNDTSPSAAGSINSAWDLTNSQPDPLLPNLLESTPNDDVDAINKAQRQMNRLDSLFCLYPMQTEDEQIEVRIPEAPPMERFKHRLLIKCLQLKLDLEVEPIFASMALYNLRERKKVSENFYFDLTSEPILKMLEPHVSYSDTSTLSRACIFDVTHPSPDLFIVIKLEKVLQQGEITEVAEPYMSDKNRDRARANAVYYCQQLGKYRMPFAWTGIYLMNLINNASVQLQQQQQQLQCDTDQARSDSLDHKSSGGILSPYDSFRKGSMDRTKGSTPDKRDQLNTEELGCALEHFRPVTITVSSFFKQEADKLTDEDLFKFLAELKKPTYVLKKLKCIPGLLKLDISPCPMELSHCLTPELYRIDPYPDDKVRPIKEIVEFPTRDVFEPFLTYRNLLYVSPKNLNFANRQGSARNIAIKVCFMDGETEELPVIFGKSSCPEFQKEAYTTVCYHSKTPSFYEEIKMQLPARLGDGHHLLFTIYHISCQRRVDTPVGPIETVIGYTWLPLLRDGQLVTGEFCLPVSLDKPPAHYFMLHPEVQLPTMKWVDNHKGLFTVNIDAVSSVHTLDEPLDRFLGMVHAAEECKIPQRIGESNFETELNRSIGDLVQAGTGPLVRFLHLVLDKLLQMMVRPPVIAGQIVNVGWTTFEAVTYIVSRLQKILEVPCDKHGRNSLLTAYIQYTCTLPHPDLSQMSPTLSQSPSSSGPGSYATLGRPASLPVNKQQRHLSSSDPDIPNSNPGSPDTEARSPAEDRSLGSGSASRYEVQQMYPKMYGKKLVHEELALQWVVSSGSTRDLTLVNSWFFFELILKSMGEHLAKLSKLNAPRRSRFPIQYLEDISSLLTMITRDIVDRYNVSQDAAIVRGLNSSLAFFINGCFSLMDRGYVFQRIKHYCRAITERILSSPTADISGLLHLKLEFLRIVCSHEHYTTLNLPLNLPITPSGPPSPTSSIASSASQTSYASCSTQLIERGIFTELSNDYRTQHYLVGLVLSELTLILETPYPHLHSTAINCLSNLLASHDLDPRYREPEMKARIAALYLPLVNVVVDALPQLYDPNTDINHRASQIQLQKSEDGPGFNEGIARVISGSTLYNSLASNNDPSQMRRCPLSQESTQDLLVCFLWVMKNIEQRILRSWWSDIGHSKLTQILEVIYFCVSNFEYKGRKVVRQHSLQTAKRSLDMKAKMEEYILGGASARSEMINRRKAGDTQAMSAGASDAQSKLRWRKDQTQWRNPVDRISESYNRDGTDFMVEGLLGSEFSMIALDVLELIVQIVQVSDTLQNLLPYILRILLHSLALNQSSATLQNMFATQRGLVSKFPELLFEEDTELCADLCLRLLRHCSSPLASVRTHASASLYVLMRQNFEIGNNFARVKMQVTMSLSSLVGQSQNFNEAFLRKSLKTILVYAENDSELQENTFPDQVRDLVFNLHMILSDTIKMKEFHEDPEMLLDLMYRIAKGYQNSPDLRLTWLQNMAAKHSERRNYAEAAHCLIHAGGLVAEYLNMLEDRPHLPVGCVAFKHISRNVLEESAVSEDVVSPDEEGICTGKYFSESGLVGLLEHAASTFNSASIFEAVNNVYKVLIPIYEHNREYSKLAIIHGKLEQTFSNIIKHDGKRVFGTYFRVGFYGARFGDLDCQEFVYKEPCITKLSEISHRLETFYSEKFGEEYVEMIKDSNNVDKDHLNQDKAYIQITYVEPYFDLYEMNERVTSYEKNYNIKRFMFATPFTMDGRAHGELKEQYKRKTILTTLNSFPYVKTRIQVIAGEQTVLTPIEVAIEDIQKKTKELGFALYQDPPDPKMLQMVMQGSIGTTVNQGPVEIALVFLAPLMEGEIPGKHHNRLRSCFKDFLKKCGDALHKNRSLIGADQREYQRELERNYGHIRERLAPLVSSSIHTDTFRRKHKREKKVVTLAPTDGSAI